VKIDEVDAYVEELFNRPAQPVWGERAAVRPEAAPGRAAAPDEPYPEVGDERYYWCEPDEPAAHAGQAEGSWVTWEEESGEPLGVWGVVKGLLLLAAGLLLIMGLSEVGVI